MNKTICAIPRPEHPNPQFVRDAWVNLNGEWQFERDRAVSGKARKLYEAESFSERITVPFCMESELSGIWQTVWLENVPAEYIKQANYTPLR